MKVYSKASGQPWQMASGGNPEESCEAYNVHIKGGHDALGKGNFASVFLVKYFPLHFIMEPEFS